MTDQPIEVTFRVDRSMLFDMLSKMGGDTGSVGARLVGVLLGADSFSEQLGLAVYGVTVSGDGGRRSQGPTHD